MKRLAVVAVAACCIAAAAAAQPMVQRIGDRQARYKQMGAAVKAINEQLHASNPSLPVIRRNSALVARFAPQVLGWFPRGSGPETGARTRARPEIWTDAEGFRAAGVRLVVAARGFDAAARGTDVAAIRAAMRGVAGACSGCHDDFRAPER
jgi:cytochrome c556